MTTIRHARPDDAAAIATLKTTVWPGDPADAGHIAHVLGEPDHATLLAIDSGQVVGFADGFATLAADGVRRWEVDLLAVHPDHQQQGIGRSLTAACTDAARRFESAYARALIRTDNVASQRTFARCGYRQDNTQYHLLVSTSGSTQLIEAPTGSYFVPVMTLGYRGLWLEGVLNAEAFAAAQHICERFGWDTAGALISASDRAALAAAGQHGYHPAGEFQWWLRKF
jgi:ribosomal protein S18 acetylase RimI-like enzyme